MVSQVAHRGSVAASETTDRVGRDDHLPVHHGPLCPGAASARRNVRGAAQGRAQRAVDGRARDHRGGVLPRLASRPAALNLCMCMRNPVHDVVAGQSTVVVVGAGAGLVRSMTLITTAAIANITAAAVITPGRRWPSLLKYMTVVHRRVPHLAADCGQYVHTARDRTPAGQLRPTGCGRRTTAEQRSAPIGDLGVKVTSPVVVICAAGSVGP